MPPADGCLGDVWEKHCVGFACRVHSSRAHPKAVDRASPSPVMSHQSPELAYFINNKDGFSQVRNEKDFFHDIKVMPYFFLSTEHSFHEIRWSIFFLARTLPPVSSRHVSSWTHHNPAHKGDTPAFQKTTIVTSILFVSLYPLCCKSSFALYSPNKSLFP